MKPEDRKYILEHINGKSIEEISEELGIKERKIQKFLEKEGKVPGRTRPAQTVRARGNRFIPAVFLIIVLIGSVSYSNSLNGQFVWDDEDLIKDNIDVQSWSNAAQAFTKDIGSRIEEEGGFYRPLQMLTYMADYSLWKLDVRGYHLTNIILHILVALSVFVLVSMLFGDTLLAFLTAAFFVAHPIHTEAVSYISGRADPLAALFMLLTFIFYIKDLTIPMALSYILALLSRENSLILPFLILLYHAVFKERLSKRNFSLLVLFAFVYFLSRLTIVKPLLAHTASEATFLERLPGFFAALATYVRLLILPFPLHMGYGNMTFSFVDPRVIAGIFMFALLLFFILSAKRGRLISFSFGFFLIALLPFSNLYPLHVYMREHWLYLPSIGFFLILAKGVCELRRRHLVYPAFGLASVLVVSCATLTILQNRHWRDPVSFYERTLKYGDESAPSYIGIGTLFNDAHRYEDAIALLQKAITLVPDSADAYNNLGIAYYGTGKKDEAIASLKKAIAIDPNLAQAYTNLGNVYDGIGEKEKAVVAYKKAIEIDPRDEDAYNNLGVLYATLGKNKDAISAFKKALGIDPDYTQGHHNLSIAYFHEREYRLSIEHCDRAKALGFEDPQLLESLKPYREAGNGARRQHK